MKIVGLLTLVLFVSCKKDLDNNDPEKGLDGEWDYKYSSITTLSSSPDFSNYDEDNGKITFNVDGTGKMTESDGESYSFKWNATENETVRMVDLDENGEPSDTTVWKVVESEENHQVWEYNTSYSYDSEGQVVTADIDVTLELNR